MLTSGAQCHRHISLNQVLRIHISALFVTTTHEFWNRGVKHNSLLGYNGSKVPSLFSIWKNIFRLSSKLQILSLSAEYLTDATWYKLKQASRKRLLPISKRRRHAVSDEHQQTACAVSKTGEQTHQVTHSVASYAFYGFSILFEVHSWLACKFKQRFDQKQQQFKAPLSSLKGSNN